MYAVAVPLSRQCGSTIGRDQGRRADGRGDGGSSSQDSEYRTRIEGEPFTVAPRHCAVYDLVCLWTQGRKRADVKMEELIDAEIEAEMAAAAEEEAAATAEEAPTEESAEVISALEKAATDDQDADESKEALVNELMSLVSAP